MKCPRCYSENWIWHSKKEQRVKCSDCGKYYQPSTSKEASIGEKPKINEKLDVSNKAPLPLPQDPLIEKKADTIDITSQSIRSLEELLDFFKSDMSAWFVESHIINSWDVTTFVEERQFDEEGNVISIDKRPLVATNYQTKARLKPITDIPNWEVFRKDFIEAVKEESPKVPAIKRKKKKHDHMRYMAEFNLYDLHLMKLGWKPETRDSHYDHHIAIERAHMAVDDLIMKASNYDLEEIVLPWGHDFFNSDIEFTGGASTTAGTPQQNDGRWQKMWVLGRELTISIIEKLKTLAPVHVIVTPGNHDLQKIFYLGDLLEVKYENDKNVTVDNEPSLWKYNRYGNTLIGHIHAVGGKHYPTEDRLLGLMPNNRESRQDFAETEFHEWHVGHLHTKRKKKQMDEDDHQGIVIRYMRSLTSADAWHAQKGFIGAVKGAQAHVYNFMTGMEAELNFNYFFDNEHNLIT